MERLGSFTKFVLFAYKKLWARIELHPPAPTHLYSALEERLV
jgi:hypothetical protein